MNVLAETPPESDSAYTKKVVFLYNLVSGVASCTTKCRAYQLAPIGCVMRCMYCISLYLVLSQVTKTSMIYVRHIFIAASWAARCKTWLLIKLDTERCSLVLPSLPFPSLPFPSPPLSPPPPLSSPLSPTSPFPSLPFPSLPFPSLAASPSVSCCSLPRYGLSAAREPLIPSINTVKVTK